MATPIGDPSLLIPILRRAVGSERMPDLIRACEDAEWRRRLAMLAWEGGAIDHETASELVKYRLNETA